MPYQLHRLQYMEKFSCLGTECEDNCCHNWRVKMTHDELGRLKQAYQLKNQNINELVQALEPSEKGYALRFKACSAGKRCTFLNEKSHCTIHQRFGQRYLPESCRTYPRKIVVIEQNAYLYGIPSCPEIARLMLFQKNSCAMKSGGSVSKEVLQAYGLTTNLRNLSPKERFSFLLQQTLIEHCTKTNTEHPKNFFFSMVRTAELLKTHQNLIMKQSEQTWSHELSILLSETHTAPNPSIGYDASNLMGVFFEHVLQVLYQHQESQRFRQLFFKVLLSLQQQLNPGTQPQSNHLHFKSAQLNILYHENQQWLWQHYGQVMQLWSNNYIANYLHTESLVLAESMQSYVHKLLIRLWLFNILLAGHPSIIQLKSKSSDQSTLQKTVVEIIQIISRFTEHSNNIEHLVKVLNAPRLEDPQGLFLMINTMWPSYST